LKTQQDIFRAITGAIPEGANPNNYCTADKIAAYIDAEEMRKNKPRNYNMYDAKALKWLEDIRKKNRKAEPKVVEKDRKKKMADEK
jgi:hypothetical protein